MYLDAELLFSQNQKITATANSEKTVNLGTTVGSGMPVYPLVQITEGFEGLTSLTVHIQSCSKDSEPDDGDFETVMSSKKLALADIQKPCGVAFGSLPPKSGNYLRVKFEVEGTATKGAVTAALVLDRQA